MNERQQTATDITAGLAAFAALQPHELPRKIQLIDMLMNRAGLHDDLAEQVFDAGKGLIAEVLQRGHTPRLISALSRGSDFTRRVFETAIEVVKTEEAPAQKKAFLLASLSKTLPLVPERIEEFVGVGLPFIKQVLDIDVDITTKLIETLMIATAEKPALMSKVIRETLDVLPALDPNSIQDVARSIMLHSGEEATTNRVYREFAISDESPTSKWPTIVYDDAETGETRVSIGCFTGLMKEFKAAVRGKHDSGSEGREHYEAIIKAIESNAVARAREVAPSIMDIFNDRKLRRVPEADVPMSAPFPLTPPRQMTLTS